MPGDFMHDLLAYSQIGAGIDRYRIGRCIGADGGEHRRYRAKVDVKPRHIGREVYQIAPFRATKASGQKNASGLPKATGKLAHDISFAIALRHMVKKKSVFLLEHIKCRNANINEIFKITRLATNLVFMQERQ